MSDWFIESSELTGDQRKAIELPFDGHTLVSGPMGAGKTLVCCHRAAYLIENSGDSGKRLKIFVPTDVNLALLRWGMAALGLNPDSACTLDRWCRSFYRDYISQTLPVVYLDGRVDDGKTRAGVLGLLRKRPDLWDSLDQVILDDAQEFPPDVFEIMKRVFRKVHLLHDPDPSLFGRGTPEKKILGIFGLPGRSAVLRGDFRCPRTLAGLAAMWLGEKQKGYRDEFFGRLRSAARGDVPVYFRADSPEDELDRLADVVRQREYLGDRIGILVTRPRLVHRLAGDLAARGIEVEKAIAADAQNVFHPPYDFGRITPKITTYEMGRGLTFDVVLLPCLPGEAFSGLDEDQIRFSLFSGISRARKWVFLSAVGGFEFEGYSTLKKADMEGTLVMKP